MRSRSEEDYLKAIYSLSIKGSSTSTNEIANALTMKASSVTDMLKKLADKKWVNYIKYKGVTLTKEGKQIALQIIRKHRLWETFLVTNLNFKWDEVHDIAEQLEHIDSIELINRLDKHLGFPKFDPHGDPIPTKNGVFNFQERISIFEMDINEEGIIMGVSLDNKDFLDHLTKLKISIGTRVRVLEQIKFDQSMKITYDSRTEHISKEIAENILIKIN